MASENCKTIGSVIAKVLFGGATSVTSGGGL